METKQTFNPKPCGQGLLPEHFYADLKTFFGRVEGIFRLMRPAVKRTDTCIEDEVEHLLVNVYGASFAKFKKGVEKAYVRCPVSETLGGGSDDGGEAGGDVAEEGGEDKPWPVAAAGATMSACRKLRGVLQSSKIFEWFTEWCQTPATRTPGMVFRNRVYLYDRNGRAVCWQKKVSPEDRIFLGVDIEYSDSAPRTDCIAALASFGKQLDDPVLADVLEEVQRVYEKSFWANAAGLRVHMSFLALAKRGRNVDMIVYYMGPGGVGLSLITAHISAMYGEKKREAHGPQLFLRR